MRTNLLGRVVAVERWLKGQQDDYAGKVGRIVAVSQHERWFRCLVAVPGFGFATFDANDLRPLTWLQRTAIQLRLLKFQTKT